MWALHADVLKMAKTREKRERIKWFAARSIFFADVQTTSSFAKGLELAKDCEHEDARFLVSLFPDGPPSDSDQAAAVFLAQNDARCWCWATQCEAQPRQELLARSAEAGCAWAQLLGFGPLDRAEGLSWMEKAAAAGERDALSALAYSLWYTSNGVYDDARATELWKEAAELGHAEGQYSFGMSCCINGSLEQFVWMRRAAMQKHYGALAALTTAGASQSLLLAWDRPERKLFEIGAGLSAVDSSDLPMLRHEVAYVRKTVNMYEQWCREAERGVLCWLWLSRDMGLVKDIRVMIARLIWEERAAWSERTEST